LVIHIYFMVPVSLRDIKEIIFGIHEITAGGESIRSLVEWRNGNYPPNQEPQKAFDCDTHTKYLNFNICDQYENKNMIYDGLKTGFHVTPQQNVSMVVGLEFCRRNDIPNRDPIRITSERRNQSDNKLIFGSSWTLIYYGSSSIDYYPGRDACGEK
ncbi:unnamed protein product, partial [Rotaria sp. Silwood2]